MKAERLALGSAAVLTPTDAAALIGGREADVLDELRRGEPTPEAAPTSRGVVPFPRVSLGGGEGGGKRGRRD